MKIMSFNKTIMTKIFMIVFIIGLILGLAACADSAFWDNLDVVEPTDNSETLFLSELGEEILDKITVEQQTTNYDEAILVTEAIRIEAPGVYLLSGQITGQINVKSEGVVLLLDGVTISNPGKKVISSDYDLIIILVSGSVNQVDNTNLDGSEANAISTSGSLTINGDGQLEINSSKSGIKSDQFFYGLGGSITISALSGHGISADSIILSGSNVNIIAATKDGLHAETDDEVLALDPTFDYSRGFVYINQGSITINNIYGDGIQADTFVLIDGGTISISSIPIFIPATSSDGCYMLSGGVYTKVAAEDSRNYTNLYQLQESCKGIKVGEIDYEIDDNEYEITENTAYSIIINGGTITIATTDDGIHANSGNILINEGTITISTSDDAIGADKNVTINGGMITINQSYEGIEGETIDISGGYITITASDDGINASNDESTSVQRTTCYINISGGIIYVNATGDGIDSNGSIHITGGEIYIIGPTGSGDAALDSDSGIKIDGGIVIALGYSGMVETPATNSNQPSISINLSSATTGAVGVIYQDTVIAEFDPYLVFGVTRNYQSIVISHPDFTNGNSYQIVTGNITTSVTINGIITKIGEASGPKRR